MRKKASTGHPTRPKQATLPANPILCTVVPATITANASDTDPLVTKAIQNNADLLLGRILFAGRRECPSLSARTTIWRVRISGSSASLDGYDEAEILPSSNP